MHFSLASHLRKIVQIHILKEKEESHKSSSQIYIKNRITDCTFHRPTDEHLKHVNKQKFAWTYHEYRAGSAFQSMVLRTYLCFFSNALYHRLSHTQTELGSQTQPQSSAAGCHINQPGGVYSSSLDLTSATKTTRISLLSPMTPQDWPLYWWRSEDRL